MPVRAELRESLALTALANVSLRTRRPDMWWPRAAPPAHAQPLRPPRLPPPLARIGQSLRFISIALLFPFRVLFEACWCVSVSRHRIECSIEERLRLRLPGAVLVGGCSMSVFPFGRMRSAARATRTEENVARQGAGLAASGDVMLVLCTGVFMCACFM